MKKRALGSISRRKDGRWEVKVSLPSGKRSTRYVSPSVPNGEKAAHALLARMLAEVERYSGIVPASTTLGDWLELYLERANKGRAAGTIRDRKYLARKITAGLGKVRLSKFTPARVQAWADELEGSHRTRVKTLQLLRSALDEAVSLEHIQRNPASATRLERQAARQVGESWTQEQAQWFLRANEGSAQYNLWKLGLQTGARIGELLGLKVSDYNPQTGNLRIERTVKVAHEGSGKRFTTGAPKTPGSVRTFKLPPDAQLTVQAQLAHVAALRARAGEHWAAEGWLFPSEVGTLIPPDNARRAWRWALQRTDKWLAAQGVEAPGFPHIRTHDMRVTFISLALRRGVKPEVVAKMVGHSSPLITLRIYRKVFAEELDEAREMVANLV